MTRLMQFWSSFLKKEIGLPEFFQKIIKNEYGNRRLETNVSFEKLSKNSIHLNFKVTPIGFTKNILIFFLKIFLKKNICFIKSFIKIVFGYFSVEVKEK